MKTRDLIDLLPLTCFTGEVGLDREVKGGYVSDLLSDVMGFAREGEVWLTLQTHKNVIAIASLKDLAAVILVKNNLPNEDTLQQAIQEGIPIFGTNLPAFELAGKFYNLMQHE